MIDQVATFFNELGWLANLIGVGTPIIGAGFLIYRNRTTLLGVSSFVDLTTKLIVPKWQDADSVRKIIAVAIVDDNPADFPVVDLQRAGYQIKTYKQVSLKDIARLAEYDVVFLDIHGIIKDDIDEGGLKLLPKLREANPRQKICAVSSKTFDPTATAFFKQADDVQKKPVNAQKCKDVIDTLALEKLNPTLLYSCLDDETKEYGVYARRLLLKQVKDFAVSTTPVSELSEKISAVGKLDLALGNTLTDYIRILRHAVC